MARSDDNNVLLVDSIDSVDKINAGFYGRFPYPWPAAKYDYLQDPDFHAVMLNQELGAWEHTLVPADGHIWVAGCGTNQAVFTALKFPRATVVGSDLSAKSLELCAATARKLSITNLELRHESLNQVAYREQFDYVLCTGVIHHNADPRSTLERLAASLKPSGIMELMVYNRFHWVIPVAFQQAIRLLCSGSGVVGDFEGELSIARRIIADPPPSLLLRSYLGRYDSDSSESMLADELLQPVLYSYTVESLNEMVTSCDLELLLPCLDQFDKEAGTHTWNIDFQDRVVKELYEALPDVRRWQIANLLLLENSPMLWFYLQRTDSGRLRKTEHQLCDEFCDMVFVRALTAQHNFVRAQDHQYQRSVNAIPFPMASPDATSRRIIEAIDGRFTMREIFIQLGVESTFHNVNLVRRKLTTPAYPYLKAVGIGERAVKINLASVNVQQLATEKLHKFKSIKPKTVQFSPSE